MASAVVVDLAIKVDGKLALLIEVKAIGLELKDGHVKQAVDYAANQGCDWVVLTNGMIWRVYKLTARWTRHSPRPATWCGAKWWAAAISASNASPFT